MAQTRRRAADRVLGPDGQGLRAGYVDSLSRDQVISGLGGRTVIEALEAGEDPKHVWRIVAEQFEVPARLR